MTDLTRGRRDALQAITAPDSVHPGLWMDRYLARQTWRDKTSDSPPGYDKDAATKAKDDLVDMVAKARAAEGYTAAFRRWKRELQAGRVGSIRVVGATVESLGRVLIGGGAKGAGEFGIAIHHTWGVPILPGSSLKGIAALGADRYFADDAWRRRQRADRARPGMPTAYDALFGTVDESAAVRFHDAWYVPPRLGRGQRPPAGLHRDVLTVHHPSYYQKDGRVSETDDPIPVSFVSAHGSFYIALELAPDLDPAVHGGWLEAAWEALRHGLFNHGIGSKTNAGYGRFKLPRWSGLEAVQAAVEATQAAARDEARQAARQGLDAAGVVQHVLDDEGADALQGWLARGARDPIIGLTWRAEHLFAVVADFTATANGLPDLSDLSDVQRADVQVAQERYAASQVNDQGYRELSDDELQRLIDGQMSRKKLRFDRLFKDLQEAEASATGFRRTKVLLDKMLSKGKVTHYNAFLHGAKLQAEAKKRS